MEIEIPGSFDAIVFDCDGTLVDSMPAHYRAWAAVLSRYGIGFPEERFYRMGGMATEKIVGILAAEAGIPVNGVAVAAEKEAQFRLELAAIRGVPEVLAIARKGLGRLPFGVATGATRELARSELAQVGILEWFNVLVCAEDVCRHKPFPDVYLEAARRLGKDPARCLAVDDTDIGLTAARDAGMAVIDVRQLRESPQLYLSPSS